MAANSVLTHLLYLVSRAFPFHVLSPSLHPGHCKRAHTYALGLISARYSIISMHQNMDRLLINWSGEKSIGLDSLSLDSFPLNFNPLRRELPAREA